MGVHYGPTRLGRCTQATGSDVRYVCRFSRIVSVSSYQPGIVQSLGSYIRLRVDALGINDGAQLHWCTFSLQGGEKQQTALPELQQQVQLYLGTGPIPVRF
jgi:hypothetical protein